MALDADGTLSDMVKLRNLDEPSIAVRGLRAREQEQTAGRLPGGGVLSARPPRPPARHAPALLLEATGGSPPSAPG